MPDQVFVLAPPPTRPVGGVQTRRLLFCATLVIVALALIYLGITGGLLLVLHEHNKNQTTSVPTPAPTGAPTAAPTPLPTPLPVIIVEDSSSDYQKADSDLIPVCETLTCPAKHPHHPACREREGICFNGLCLPIGAGPPGCAGVCSELVDGDICVCPCGCLDSNRVLALCTDDSEQVSEHISAPTASITPSPTVSESTPAPALPTPCEFAVCPLSEEETGEPACRDRLGECRGGVCLPYAGNNEGCPSNACPHMLDGSACVCACSCFDSNWNPAACVDGGRIVEQPPLTGAPTPEPPAPTPPQECPPSSLFCTFSLSGLFCTSGPCLSPYGTNLGPCDLEGPEECYCCTEDMEPTPEPPTPGPPLTPSPTPAPTPCGTCPLPEPDDPRCLDRVGRCTEVLNCEVEIATSCTQSNCTQVGDVCVCPCSCLGDDFVVTCPPILEPTPEPTEPPTERPTAQPTEQPTERPTVQPTEQPTERPTAQPTEQPTERPTAQPTAQPTPEPPTAAPTAFPELPCNESLTPLILTGIFNGARAGDLPQLVEMLAIRDIPDLSLFTLRTSSDAALPAISAVAGDFMFATNNASAFLDFFTIPANFTFVGLDANGTQSAQLLLNGSVVDTYGDGGVDCGGEPCLYEDGWAYRKDGFGPAPVWIEEHWTVIPFAYNANATKLHESENEYPACTFVCGGLTIAPTPSPAPTQE